MSQLVGASEADPDIGYMGRQLTLCCLPRTNPGDKSQYLREDGPYQLGMSAGPGFKLPYGSLPRLVLVWMCSEATRTQSRILTLGNSFLDFMHQIGITSNSGGKRSYRTRLQDQMERLFNSTVQMSYKDERGAGTVGSRVADRTQFWWDPKRPGERVLWQSTVELSEKITKVQTISKTAFKPSSTMRSFLLGQIEQGTVPIPFKEAIQTLHQAILCGLVVSGDVFHIAAHQNEPPRPALAFGCADVVFGDPDLFLDNAAFFFVERGEFFFLGRVLFLELLFGLC